MANPARKPALVILADVRHSRLIADRSLVQTGLRQITERVNQDKGDLVTVPFSISGGDEIQGLLLDPVSMIEIIDSLDLNSAPFNFRFGVGWGEVTTPWADRTWEMDGECFHHAREAVVRGKKEDRWVTVSGFGPAADDILNGVWRAVQVIREGWTKKQRLAVTTQRAHRTQTATAKALGLDPSTLSKMLKAAHYKSLIEIETAIRTLLAHLIEDAR